MPTNKIQKRKIKLTERAEDEAQSPETRLKAAKSLLIFSHYARRPWRLAKKIATLYLNDGTITTETREKAVKLLELTMKHEAVDDDDPKLALQVAIDEASSPPKKNKEHPNGINIWEDEAARRAWCHGTPAPEPEAVEAPEPIPAPIPEPAAQPVAKVPRPTHNEYGVLNLTPYAEIEPRLDLSQPPEPGFLQHNARATCSICQNVGVGLIEHDCMRYQISNS